MKKIIALTLAFLLVMMSLAGCGSTSSGKIEELKQQVETLETRISELEKSEELRQKTSVTQISELEKSEEIQDDGNSSIPTDETTVTSETSEDNANTSQQMLDYLDSQAKSNDSDQWLQVANCDIATEKHLLQIAENLVSSGCFDYRDNVDIAKAISENPNCTDNVMQKLSEFEDSYDIWLIIAESVKSKEGALLLLAENLVSSGCFDYWDEVDIARAISENPNCTNNVMQKLSKSENSDISAIGHQWIENHK